MARGMRVMPRHLAQLPEHMVQQEKATAAVTKKGSTKTTRCLLKQRQMPAPQKSTGQIDCVTVEMQTIYGLLGR